MSKRTRKTKQSKPDGKVTVGAITVGADNPEKLAQRAADVVPATFSADKEEQRTDRDLMERTIRRFNIKYDTPPMRFVTKTVRYDCERKQIVSAQYEIEKG